VEEVYAAFPRVPKRKWVFRGREQAILLLVKGEDGCFSVRLTTTACLSETYRYRASVSAEYDTYGKTIQEAVSGCLAELHNAKNRATRIYDSLANALVKNENIQDT
jgi:hypothetical protein